jgi:C-terminal processing protease CtpA/Prc
LFDGSLTTEETLTDSSNGSENQTTPGNAETGFGERNAGNRTNDRLRRVRENLRTSSNQEADTTNEGSTTSNSIRDTARSSVFNQGAVSQRLGWEFETNDADPLTLASVTDGSWADRLGFQAGDQIVSIGGEEIANYSGLIRYLRTHRDGSTTVQVERDGGLEAIDINLATLRQRLIRAQPRNAESQ